MLGDPFLNICIIIYPPTGTAKCCWPRVNIYQSYHSLDIDTITLLCISTNGCTPGIFNQFVYSDMIIQGGLVGVGRKRDPTPTQCRLWTFDDAGCCQKFDASLPRHTSQSLQVFYWLVWNVRMKQSTSSFLLAKCTYYKLNLQFHRHTRTYARTHARMHTHTHLHAYTRAHTHVCALFLY